MTNYLQQKTLHTPQIGRRPARNLGICVVIPVFDEPTLLRTLMNLKKCDLPTCSTEVIVVINNGVHVSTQVLERNRAVYLQATEWAKKNLQPLLKFHILFHDDLPKMFANADLARKIGMDEAVFRFEKAKRKRGIIAVLDADCRVGKNYLTALEKHFRKRLQPRVCYTDFAFEAVGIHYSDAVYEASLQYELHLRYVNRARHFAGFAENVNALPTCFAVDCETYQKRGGWSSVLAKSELLHGAHRTEDCTVIPSPRIKNCRAEGTGNNIKKATKEKGGLRTFDPRCFAVLQRFVKANGKKKSAILADLEDCADCIRAYFKSIDFADCALNDECLSDFFAAMHLETYLDFAHREFYVSQPVLRAAKDFLQSTVPDADFEHLSLREVLDFYRKG